MKIFTIYDKKTQTYDRPFLTQTEVHAVRMFKVQINDPARSTMLAMAPTDFDLCLIGEFNDQTAALNAHNPVTIATGDSLKE